MTEVVCPDCGKYIAPEGAVAKNQRCRCADEDGGGAHPGTPPPATHKRCYICSTDLSGRKRLKDHLGRYWCAECAKADERAKKRVAENQCPDCSRLFAPIRLVEHGDDRVCKQCYKKRLEETQKKLVKMGQAAASKRHELKYIKWMAIALIVLLVLATYNQYFR